MMKEAVRPTPKALLPVRVIAREPVIVLGYDSSLTGPDGVQRTIPLQFHTPLTFAQAVLEVLERFWELEGKVDGLTRECEESRARIAEQEAVIVKKDHQLAELQKRVERQGGNLPGKGR